MRYFEFHAGGGSGVADLIKWTSPTNDIEDYTVLSNTFAISTTYSSNVVVYAISKYEQIGFVVTNGIMTNFWYNIELQTP